MTNKVEDKKSTKEVKSELKKVKLSDERLAEMRASLRGSGSAKALEKYKVPGFYHRLVNTTEEQMARYNGMGYEPVVDATGKTVRRKVGGGVEQILMRISLEEKAILSAIKERETASDVEQVNPEEKALADVNYYQALKNYNS